MTRDELIHLYEQSLIDFLSNTPCVSCGGSEFLAAQNVKMAGFFFVELSESWKDKQADQMSVANAAKRSRKKMERYFNELTEKELERVLPSPDDGTSDEDAPTSEPATASPPSQPSPSPSPTPPEESPRNSPSPEAPKTPEPPPEEEDQSSDPEKHDQAHAAESSDPNDPPEESSPPPKSEGPESRSRPRSEQ